MGRLQALQLPLGAPQPLLAIQVLVILLEDAQNQPESQSQVAVAPVTKQLPLGMLVSPQGVQLVAPVPVE